jgi:DNA repair exonuclease SbcCD ATPase subunit
MATGVDQATERLSLAIDRLEAAIGRQAGARVDKTSLETEIQTLGTDRARLADLLDKSEAKASRLESINRDVSHKLVEAMETVRSVLQTETGGP